MNYSDRFALLAKHANLRDLDHMWRDTNGFVCNPDPSFYDAAITAVHEMRQIATDLYVSPTYNTTALQCFATAGETLVQSLVQSTKSSIGDANTLTLIVALQQLAGIFAELSQFTPSKPALAYDVVKKLFSIEYRLYNRAH